MGCSDSIYILFIHALSNSEHAQSQRALYIKGAVTLCSLCEIVQKFLEEFVLSSYRRTLLTMP